jgi:hypothetical protein
MTIRHVRPDLEIMALPGAGFVDVRAAWRQA